MKDALPLNKGQQDAADGFFGFLFEDAKECGVDGPGGVGKSFWVSHIIDVVIPRYLDTCKLMGIEPEFDSVVMTATTNKAAEILAEATGRPVTTIHSFMNLKVKDDYSKGKSSLEKTRLWTVHTRKIIFIDECSMIDTPLDNMIQEGTQDCKIVYVGDRFQLAPIFEDLSPIYKRDFKWFHLTQQMRNSGSPALMNICEQLRYTVDTGTFLPLQIVPGSIDLMDDNDLADGMEAMFKDYDHKSRILAFTNNRVIQYNDHIRGLRSLPDEFTQGEILINNSAIQMRDTMLSVEAQVTIIDLNPKSVFIPIAKDIDLECHSVTLSTKYGAILENVLLPVDREHFNALVKYFAKQKNWERYFYLKNTFPDLRQRDASTVHKSQGSTYDTTFIDLANISTCNIADQVARMLYVAFSRAKHRVFVYGQLAPKYGGLTY